MRTIRWIAVFLLVGSAATAQDTRVTELDAGGLLHPHWSFEHRSNLRMVGGGRNSYGEAQAFSCTLAEFESRSGRCTELPADEQLEYGFAVRIDDVEPHRMAEFHGRKDGWRVREGDYSKSTQGLARGKYVKRSPGQGAMISLYGTNSAQGDFMGISLTVDDTAGAQAAGDEGMMPVWIYMRDHSHPATGTTIQKLRPGSRSFRGHLTSGKEQHDDQAAPRRLVVWTDAPRIPFAVSVEGHNPKPHPPLGGATWKLDTTLSFAGGELPGNTLDFFGHERTDWCATLDATAYDGGLRHNYVLVSRFDGPRQFTTHRLLAGQNVGLYENQYVQGFEAIDHAVGAGHTRGHLAPCSLIVDYDSGQQEFAIAPMIDSTIARGTSYEIPSMGTMRSEGVKVAYDFKLGTGQARTGFTAKALGGPDNRMGTHGFEAKGRWREAFSSTDADAMLLDFHEKRRAPKYVFARLRGSSTWHGHELEVWYPEPNGRGQARVQLPHYPGDSAFVLVSRGKGPPTAPCLEPGLQRYYDLAADREYICSSALEWKSH